MPDERVINYIQTYLEKGFSLSAIQQKLTNSFVPIQIINECTMIAKERMSFQKQQLNVQKISTSGPKSKIWLWITLLILFLLGVFIFSIFYTIR